MFYDRNKEYTAKQPCKATVNISSFDLFSLFFNSSMGVSNSFFLRSNFCFFLAVFEPMKLHAMMSVFFVYSTCNGRGSSR